MHPRRGDRPPRGAATGVPERGHNGTPYATDSTIRRPPQSVGLNVVSVADSLLNTPSAAFDRAAVVAPTSPPMHWRLRGC